MPDQARSTRAMDPGNDCIRALDEEEDEEDNESGVSNNTWAPNYVLRAPYPTFHLLREADLQVAKRGGGERGERASAHIRKRNALWLAANSAEVPQLWARSISLSGNRGNESESETDSTTPTTTGGCPFRHLHSSTSTNQS